MEKLDIREEAFKAGFKWGYTNGRASELTSREFESNANLAYQRWLEERSKPETENK